MRTHTTSGEKIEVDLETAEVKIPSLLTEIQTVCLGKPCCDSECPLSILDYRNGNAFIRCALDGRPNTWSLTKVKEKFQNNLNNAIKYGWIK